MPFTTTKSYIGQTIPTNFDNAGVPELRIDASVDPSWNDCEVIGGLVQGSVHIVSARNLRLNGVEVTSPNGIGIYLSQTGTQDVEITGCFVHDTGNDGIYVDEGTATTAPRHVNLRLTNNRLYSVAKGVVGDTAAERHAIECFAKDCVIQGNDINNVPRGHGMKIHSSAYVANNKIRNTGRNSIGLRGDRSPGAGPIRVTQNDCALTGQRADSTTFGPIAVYNFGSTYPAIEIDRNTIVTGGKTAVLVEAGLIGSITIHDNTIDGVGPVVTPPLQPPTAPPSAVPGVGMGEPRSVPGTICIVQADGPAGSALLVDTDYQLRAKTVALAGGAKMVAYGSTGRRAVRLDGLLTSYIEVAHADLAVGTADAAVEVIWRPDAVLGGATLFDLRDAAGANGFAVGVTATDLRLLVGTVDGGGGAHPALGAVQYAATARVNGTVRGYAGLTTAASAGLVFTAGHALNASQGRIRVGAGIRGLILGVRVSKRTGRGMTASTVPVLSSFPVL
ncbi:right-handed parallel beta-helix repeat-containing protein [Azospirillum sp. sgz301742]